MKYKEICNAYTMFWRTCMLLAKQVNTLKCDGQREDIDGQTEDMDGQTETLTDNGHYRGDP